MTEYQRIVHVESVSSLAQTKARINSEISIMLRKLSWMRISIWEPQQVRCTTVK